jgi:hypothetical protein
LKGLKIRVADLPGDQLAEIAGRTLTIDTNAAGHGWFVDATPRRNEEFARRGARTVRIATARTRYDLLTVLTHEIGHALRLGHTPQGVMSATLKPGVRLLPGRLGAKIGR